MSYLQLIKDRIEQLKSEELAHAVCEEGLCRCGFADCASHLSGECRATPEWLLPFDHYAAGIMWLCPECHREYQWRYELERFDHDDQIKLFRMDTGRVV